MPMTILQSPIYTLLVFPRPAQILHKLLLSNAFENMLSSQNYTVYAFLRRGEGRGKIECIIGDWKIRNAFAQLLDPKLLLCRLRSSIILFFSRSDEWNLLSPEERKRLNLVFDDDGEFW